MRIFRQGLMGFNFDGVRVQWFPLHMRRAMEKMSSSFKKVDVVIEVRDARIPISSQNDRFEHLLGKKKRIVVYNKSDLADEKMNKVS
jgi:ribosome biogenesis GTPase A